MKNKVARIYNKYINIKIISRRWQANIRKYQKRRLSIYRRLYLYQANRLSNLKNKWKKEKRRRVKCVKKRRHANMKYEKREGMAARRNNQASHQ